MGRFYRTASANPLDYMYRMNVPLMEKVLSVNDQYITDNLQGLAKLEGAVDSFPYLQPDNERVKQIVGDYNSKIDNITAAIKADPANWRKQLDPIQNLSRQLKGDYATGEISKIVGNYNQYKQVSDFIDKSTGEYGKTGKGISADRARAYKQYFLSQFTKADPKGTNYNSTTGEYNQIQAFNPMNNIDIRKQLSDGLDKMKADGQIRVKDQLTGEQEYFNKETNKWEGITPERVLRIVTDRLNDPQLMDYLKQDTQVGLVNGVYDTNPESDNYGQFISPYNYDKVQMSTSEQGVVDSMQKQIEATKNNTQRQAMQQQLDNYKTNLAARKELTWNPSSYLAPILRGLVKQYSYEKTTNQDELRANPIWQSKFTQGQENQRQDKAIRAKKEMQQKAFDNSNQQLKDRIASNEKIAAMRAAGKGKPGEVKKDNNYIAGSVETTPFAYLTDTKDKLTDNIIDELNVNKNGVDQLTSTLNELAKEPEKNKLLIANTENQIADRQAITKSLQDKSDAAINFAVDQWKAKGGNADHPYNDYAEGLVRNFVSGKLKTDFDEANSNFMKVDAQRKSMDKTDPNYSTFLKQSYYPALARKNETQGNLVGTQKMFNDEVKGFMNDKLEKSATETTNRANVIGTTDTQDKRIKEMFQVDPSRFKIYDKQGRETHLKFDQLTADPEKVKIRGISTTTGIGDKGIQVIANVGGQDVIITPKDDGGIMNNYFAQEFSKSTDKDIKNIGQILSSPTAATISDMLTEMRMNTGSKSGTKDAWIYRNLPNPSNPNEVLRIRVRDVSTGNREPKWELQLGTDNEALYYKNTVGQGKHVRDRDFTVDSDGKLKGFIPLTSSTNKAGIYGNLEDILSIFPSH